MQVSYIPVSRLLVTILDTGQSAFPCAWDVRRKLKNAGAEFCNRREMQSYWVPDSSTAGRRTWVNLGFLHYFFIDYWNKYRKVGLFIVTTTWFLASLYDGARPVSNPVTRLRDPRGCGAG
jgi:hypothetical protein